MKEDEPIDFSDLDDYKNPKLAFIKKIIRKLKSILFAPFRLIRLFLDNIFGYFSNIFYSTSELLGIFHPNNTGTVFGFFKWVIIVGCLFIWVFCSTLVFRFFDLGKEPSFVVGTLLTYLWYKLTITYPMLGVFIGVGMYLYLSGAI